MDTNINLADLSAIMKKHGAHTIIFKTLSNNDNSKQQVYFGSDFDILRNIPTGDICEGGHSERKGAIFKASVPLSWVDSSGNIEKATGSQLILYPKYPEVRLSGFLKGCALAPSQLMRPPTKDEREQRLIDNSNRCLILGICDSQLLAYASHWGSSISRESAHLIKSGEADIFTSVFYKYREKSGDPSTREKLILRLSEIYRAGIIESCRLDKNGKRIPYIAQNAPGLTLESYFGITPNGRSEPDFMDWELKAHSSNPVTLMTPEPDRGSYLESLESFLHSYATSKTDKKMNFASIHRMNELNTKSSLTMRLIGFDAKRTEITDAKGGMILEDKAGKIAAGWSFKKLLNHWKRKHSNTCFVAYKKEMQEVPCYVFGPQIRLCTGADIKTYLSALADGVIYYDPGSNIKLQPNGKWKPKKRNQFRIKWKDVSSIYEATEDIVLD